MYLQIEQNLILLYFAQHRTERVFIECALQLSFAKQKYRYTSAGRDDTTSILLQEAKIVEGKRPLDG
jgi:hypothetical protein